MIARLAVGVCTLLLTLGAVLTGAIWKNGVISHGDTGDGNGAIDGGLLQVATGANHSLAIVKGGDIYGWGSNDCGQLGIVDSNNGVPQKIIVEGNIKFKAISAGDGSDSFAISESGDIYGWGNNIDYQIGLGDNSESYITTPTKINVTGNPKFIAMSTLSI